MFHFVSLQIVTGSAFAVHHSVDVFYWSFYMSEDVQLNASGNKVFCFVFLTQMCLC